MPTYTPPPDSPSQAMDDIKLGLGLKFELLFEKLFTRWGIFVAHHPIPIMIISLTFSLVLACGLTKIKVTVDPVDLWVASGSQARSDMEYFGKTFWKFYRIEHIIAAPKNNETFRAKVLIDDQSTEVEFGPVFRREFMKELFELQQRIENITVMTKNKRSIKLSDICYKPLSRSDSCATQSVFKYFRDISELDDDKYLQKVYECPM